ncbi:MAG: nucleoside-diphosphate sugar epimerase/dehydratase [Desulfobacterales bacterium]|jgi:FlaA1/EpsC-like NDP-sugar epimerase
MKVRANSIYSSIYALSKTAFVTRLIDWILPFRFWLIVAVHALMFALSYVGAFFIFYAGIVDIDIGASSLMWRTLPVIVVIRLAVFWHQDLFQGLWRYVSFEDLVIIVRAAIISSIMFILAGIFYDPLRTADVLYLLDWILCIMLCGGIRFVARNFRENVMPSIKGIQADNVLMVGPVREVYPVVKNLVTDPYSHFNPVAIVDPQKDTRIGSTRISDVPVWSPDQAVQRRKRLRNLVAVIVCWPDAGKKQMDRLVEDLKPLQVPFKILPDVEDILTDKVTISDIRDVEIEDLLERPPIRIEMNRIRKQIEGKKVLVSGGGGSIGSELCRQVAGFNPGLLVVLDRAESPLYDLDIELRKTFPDLPIEVSLSTINDYPGLSALLKRLKIDTIFHAAAYKHVPMMEIAPIESAYNNIMGTNNLAQAAIEARVERFVMVSTDKAVNPTNVMGVTKRIAEMLVQSYNSANHTRFMTVRFGNVLGSIGSVSRLFKTQIAVGGPVTVTHPDIERFFMTIPEAVQLVLQAGTMGDGGEIFVLEMGEPVKILHLAEKLIALSGKRPHNDIEIEFIGLRPGEKMYEELFHHGEEQLPTSHEQIRVAKSRLRQIGYMKEKVDEIRELVMKKDVDGLKEKFKELVPEYCSADNSCINETDMQ